jgi:ATP-binding cassette subfamily A (ABC1) protein 3
VPFRLQSALKELFSELEDYKDVTISLEMNSLEDAFINIGMDEENFMKEHHSESTES